MSGRRLLDVATVLKAARGVASKYATLQRNQLDLYSKTSSLTKAVRYQTGQGAGKVGAGSALVASSGQDSKAHAPGKGIPVPSQTGTNGGRKQVENNSGLEQDLFYTKSEAITTAQPFSNSELGVKQEKAKRYPIPDGSIPPAKIDISASKPDQDTFSETTKIGSGEGSLTGKTNGTNSGFRTFLPGGTSISDPEAKAKQPMSGPSPELQRDSETQIPSVSAQLPNVKSQPEATPQDSVVDRNPINLEQDVFLTRCSKATQDLSSLPKVKLPKETGDTQGGEFHIPDDSMNQDVFYSVPSKNRQKPVPEVQAVPEQEQPSDDMYSEIFHSPRVAKLLKGESKQDNAANDLKLRAVHETPVEQAKLLQEKDQESFNIRSTRQDPSRTMDDHDVTKDPSPPKKADAEDAHKLAEAIAHNVAKASSAKPEVSIEIHLSRELLADKLTVIP